MVDTRKTLKVHSVTYELIQEAKEVFLKHNPRVIEVGSDQITNDKIIRWVMKYYIDN